MDDLDCPLERDDEDEKWVQCCVCGHAIYIPLADNDCGDPNCPGRRES